MSTTAFHAPHPTPAWPDGDARSDHVPRVGGALAGLLGPCGSLLDVGAGDGTLGRRRIHPTSRWTAIEPNAVMARRPADAMAAAPRDEAEIVTAPWQDAGRPPRSLPRGGAAAWGASAQHGPRRW
jgi:hypothetical protein